MSEYAENPILGLTRTFKLTRAAGGIAMRGIGEKMGFNVNHDKFAEALKQTLGELRGPAVKFVQIIASIPDVIPEEYVKELSQLQSNAPPMGKLFVKRRMRAELGDEWESKFANFNPEPSAAASLGQVHRAKSHEGRELACKLQYPSMEEAINSDLNQLKFFFSLYERVEGSIRLGAVVEELRSRFLEELDYGLEASRMRMYRKIFETEDNIHVPEPLSELSTNRLLVSEWVDGDHILSVRDKPIEERNQVAKHMFKAWYLPLYGYAMVHGDPHFGNYTLRKDGGINLLDFGCVRVFEPEFVDGILKLYCALRDDDKELAVEAYKLWGFKNLNKQMVEVLNQWAGFIYRPLLEDKIRRIDEENHIEVGTDRINGLRKELNKIGGVDLPAEFVFVDRSAVGLGALFMHLRAEINWHREFNELIDGFDVEKVRNSQQRLKE